MVYTSGTTGRPKGVELTQRNFCYMALMIGEALPEVIDNKKTRLLLFLPLAHVFARFPVSRCCQDGGCWPVFPR
ncbi:AMP-binding protein [Mobiluncus mulieris]|uniref:AMP-binding protein n=1 Tax=Mobiluncus mulieris TaxID=2052 RepID=UPI00210063E1|nr:AMP-binding protein [Mobiluncus mulieris]